MVGLLQCVVLHNNRSWACTQLPKQAGSSGMRTSSRWQPTVKPKVYQADVSIVRVHRSEDDVFWMHVPVEDRWLMAMQVREC